MALEVMNRTEEATVADKDTLYMLGGVALVIVGAGLVLTNPTAPVPRADGLGQFCLSRYTRHRTIFPFALDVAISARAA